MSRNMFLEPYVKWCFLFALFCNGSTNFNRRNKFRRLENPPLPTSHVPIPPDNWFTQLLDHARPTDTRTWQQRYQVVNDYYKEGGPVFVIIEGEGEASAKSLVEYANIDYAKQYNAMMFQLEHRYYGESRPTSDVSVENLKYLTSEQALADVAYFIVGMNRHHKLPPDTKWVAFGGSYAGNLAAWVRYKYPHLVHAAVASSAPVLAQVDFPGYMNVAKESLATYSSKCVEDIQAAYKQLKYLLETREGEETIMKLFRLCDPIDPKKRNDVSNLMSTLALHFGSVAQGNKVNDDYPGSNITIDILCDIMVNQTLGSPVIRLAAVNTLILKSRSLESCLDFKYEKYINNMKNTSYIPDFDREWMYQKCTEFGVFHTSEDKTSLFGDSAPLDFFTQKCGDIFGKEFTKELIYQGVDRSNILHGGLDIKATRVVYVHGSIDPWHALGITKTRIPESPVIYINGTAHCANVCTLAKTDLPGLKAAREEISSLIGKWLKEP